VCVCVFVWVCVRVCVCARTCVCAPIVASHCRVSQIKTGAVLYLKQGLHARFEVNVRQLLHLK